MTTPTEKAMLLVAAYSAAFAVMLHARATHGKTCTDEAMIEDIDRVAKLAAARVTETILAIGAEADANG